MEFKKSFRFFALILSFILMILIIFVCINTTDKVQISTASVLLINDGWDITINDQTSKNVELLSFDTGVINEGDVVILSKNIDDYNLNGTCLSFYTTHAICNVYFDDDLIYSYGQDLYDKQRMVPKKHQYIPLSGNYYGKTLKIKLIGARRASFSELRPVYVGPRSEILSLILINSWVAIVIGFFLFTLAMLLIVLSPYLFLYHNKDLRIFFSGLISLMLAVYILAFNSIFDVLINNALLNNVLEYAALYNIPTAIVGYLMSIYKEKEKKVFVLLFFLDICLFLLSITIHFTHIARFSDFTATLHLIAAIECSFSIFVILRNYFIHKKNGNTHAYSSENIFVIGLIIFMLFSILDIIRYNCEKYGLVKGRNSNYLFGFTTGALIFVLSLLVSYFFYNIYSSNIDSMQSRIINLAYIDALTGLANRTRCEQMMKMLTEEHGTYAMISLDLNKLKHVNDTLGHNEGDRLLTGFATILSDAFWDANLIGRMGGDEFLVILLEDRVFNVSKRIHDLYSLINEWNNKEQMFKYSASYGYAYSYEVPSGSASEVYMLADNRMYEMKREHHNENKEVL